MIGSVIGASHDAEVGTGRPLGRGRQEQALPSGAVLLEGAQRCPGSAQARHQGADRDAERVRGLLVGEALDRHEVKNGALLVGQGQERSADLLRRTLLS